MKPDGDRGTSRPRRPLPLRLLLALRRLLLPRPLRHQHGAEMDADISYRYMAAEGRTRAHWRIVRHELRDVLRTAIDERRERRDAAHDSRSSRTRLPRGVIPMLDGFSHDVRQAFRILRSSPLITVVSAVTLALGIGAVTAVFTVVNAVLLQPLPYAAPQGLVVVWTNFGPDLPQNWISGPEYAEIRELSTTLENFAVVSLDSVLLTGVDEPEQLPAAVVSGSLFSILRVEAARGRVIEPQDDRLEAAAVAVISDGLWHRRFGGAAEAIGSTVTLDGQPATVVGVLPPDFGFHHPNVTDPQGVDLWLPLQPTYSTAYEGMSRGSHFLLGLGRLRDGASVAQLDADLEAVAAAMVERHPNVYGFEGWGLDAYSLHQDLVEGQRSGLAVLLGAVSFVLLIACVNVANLQLTRATVREREIAVRAALGAGRRRLLQQLMSESLVLAAIGATLGLALAVVLVRALSVWLPPGMPRAGAIGIDVGVVAFVVAVSVVTAALFGIAPGLFASRIDTTRSLKDGGRGTAGGAGGKLRGLLVVVEVCLALVLAVGAGLMLRSFDEIMRVDPGYRLESILTTRISLPPRYDAQSALAFWEELLPRVRSIPGVTEAGAISQLPLSGSYSSGTTLAESSELVITEEQYPFIEADRRYVSVGYFEAMGVPLLQGRGFVAADNEDGAPVAVVDEEFARRFWGDAEPLGKRVATEFDFDPTTRTIDPSWREVVGVVRHSRHYDLTSVGREQVYVPLSQRPTTGLFLAVRTSGDPSAAAPAIRQYVREIDADVPMSDVRTMRERAAQSMSRPRFDSLLFSAFAGVALLLAAIGIYGVMAFSVGQRTAEIGVRMALGADRAGVQRMVLRNGLLLAATGIAAGFVAALALVRVLEGMLYGVSPADPVTFAGVAAVLGIVALLASWVPAVRATRVEPVEALRRQ